MRILFVGGGSVGHIAPAIAIWEELHTMHPSAEAFFVCSRKHADQDFLRRENVRFKVIDAPRFGLGLAFGILKALKQSKGIIVELKPDVVFCKGGYVSVPVCLSAWRLGVPIILHESDAVMGRANRVIARFATHVCLGFEKAAVSGQRSAVSFTGNPVRRTITQGSREKGLRITGFAGKRPILLIMGGSQGAKALNDTIAAKIDEILSVADVIHITGEGKKEEGRGKIKVQSGYFVIEFAYDELPHFYAITNIALSRAGAGSIAELEACGIPTILVPLRGVGHDHQYVNAVRACETSGLFVRVEQSELEEKLLQSLHTVMVRPVSAMATPGRQAHHDRSENAARHIAQILLNTLEETRRHQ